MKSRFPHTALVNLSVSLFYYPPKTACKEIDGKYSEIDLYTNTH